MTYEECIVALGQSEGISFRMKGRREIPQTLYENGFIEHDRSPIFSHTNPSDITNYIKVIFDKGEFKGKIYEFRR